jgi:acyl carrier protein
MNKTEIHSKVREFIKNNFLEDMDPSEFTDDTSFEQIVDSAQAMDIILFVEETFDITVENEDVLPENFDTVNCVVDFVAEKLKED